MNHPLPAESHSGDSTTAATASEKAASSGLIPPTIFAVLALALCIVVPGILVVATPSNEGVAWLYTIVVITSSGSRLSWLVGLGKPRLYELAFWTFTYAFMGLAPLIQIRTGTYPVPGLTFELNVPTLMVLILGVICVLAGACLLRPLTVRIRPSESLNASRTVTLAVVALMMNALFVWRIGPATFLQSRDELRIAESALTDNVTYRSIVVCTTTVPLLVSFHALLTIRRTAGGIVRQLLTALVVLVSCAALFSVNPVSSPRYLVGTFILSMAAGLGAYKTPLRVRAMALSFLAGLIAVFPIADVFRHSSDAIVDASEADPIRSLTSGDFDAYAQLNNALLFVHDEGLTWGRQGFGVLLFWIPREFWPTKPEDTGVMLAEFRGYGFTNMSAPVWAEFYVNFGIVGVAVGMILIGRFMRRADDGASVTAAANRRTSVIGMVLPFYSILILRGSLLQAMAFLCVLLVCAYWVRTWRAQRPTATLTKPRVSLETGIAPPCPIAHL